MLIFFFQVKSFFSIYYIFPQTNLKQFQMKMQMLFGKLFGKLMLSIIKITIVTIGLSW